MRWNPRFANRSLSTLCLLAAASAFSGVPASAPAFVNGATEMSFMKGDTRNGSRVQLRIVGDSLFYRETLYSPEASPVENSKRLFLHGQRRRALQGVMGELPRYPAFGTCFGKDMRFYLVETEAGKFYRSLPERAGKCYLDEPGIWSLFQDLDALLAPPTEPESREYSAS
jgi:hypothetical protein